MFFRKQRQQKYKNRAFIFDFVVTLKAVNTGHRNLCDMALYQPTQKQKQNNKNTKSILYVCDLRSGIKKKKHNWLWKQSVSVRTSTQSTMIVN